MTNSRNEFPIDSDTYSFQAVDSDSDLNNLKDFKPTFIKTVNHYMKIMYPSFDYVEYRHGTIFSSHEDDVLQNIIVTDRNVVILIMRDDSLEENLFIRMLAPGHQQTFLLEKYCLGYFLDVSMSDSYELVPSFVDEYSEYLKSHDDYTYRPSLARWIDEWVLDPDFFAQFSVKNKASKNVDQNHTPNPPTPATLILNRWLIAPIVATAIVVSSLFAFGGIKTYEYITAEAWSDGSSKSETGEFVSKPGQNQPTGPLIKECIFKNKKGSWKRIRKYSHVSITETTLHKKHPRSDCKVAQDCTKGNMCIKGFCAQSNDVRLGVDGEIWSCKNETFWRKYE